VTTISLCSAKGSPGVTTLACAMAAVWDSERRVLLAECDPSGGDLAIRFGLSTRSGMANLVLAHRHGPTSASNLDDQIQRLPGGLEVLIGPVGSDSASALDDELPSVLSHLLPGDADVLVDCGRFVPGARGQSKLLSDSEIVLVVTRPDASGLTHTRWLLEKLHEKLRPHGRFSVLRLVLVGEGTFSPSEISHTLGIEVFEVVPNDPTAAAVISGVPGRAHTFARSSLLSCAKRLGHRLRFDTNRDLPAETNEHSSDLAIGRSATPHRTSRFEDQVPVQVPSSSNGNRTNTSVP
jgi:MinD-like ATPase involved in chromosome partitioning or flagellar assembly